MNLNLKVETNGTAKQSIDKEEGRGSQDHETLIFAINQSKVVQMWKKNTLYNNNDYYKTNSTK